MRFEGWASTCRLQAVDTFDNCNVDLGRCGSWQKFCAIRPVAAYWLDKWLLLGAPLPIAEIATPPRIWFNSIDKALKVSKCAYMVLFFDHLILTLSPAGLPSEGHCRPGWVGLAPSMFPCYGLWRVKYKVNHLNSLQ